MSSRLQYTMLLVAATVGACSGDDGDTAALPPAVLVVNGATMPSGPIGSTVIIEGQNFGATQGSGQVLFTTVDSGTVAATITSPGDWTDGYIVTTVPVGAVTGPLIVTTAGGSTTPVTFTVTQNVAFSPSTIAWTETSSLPVALSGLAAGFVELRQDSTTTRVVYVIGGESDSGGPVSTAYHATVQNTGALSAWASTAAMPTTLSFAAVVAATPFNSQIASGGFLYVVGGVTDTAGTPTAAVHRAALGSDGAITQWTTVTALPIALHSARAWIFHGNLYVAGGSTTGNVPSASVYRAHISADGSLGAWAPMTSLPFARSYFGAGQFGAFLYVLGGDTGTVAPNASASSKPINNVAFAEIDLRTGDFKSGWTANASGMTKTSSKHTVVSAGGNVLATAGLYNGAQTGSSEESYAQINTNGTVGSFNGATGSNTIQSLGGGNLFNHAAIGYMDGDGVFHVLVLGGDDVNSPGTKHSKVYYY